jgi:hypothetical protein
MGELVVPRIAVTAVGGPPPARLDPPLVDVVVRGPQRALETLATDAVAASVDVRELDDRPPGSYVLPVTVGGLVAGVSGVARPASARVTLTRRAAPREPAAGARAGSPPR